MFRFIFLFVLSFALIHGAVYSQHQQKRQSDEGEVCVFPIMHKAYFLGELDEFVKKNICYPNKHEEGKVFVSFEVDTNGNVVNPEILKGFSEEYNNEALRILKIMPPWAPAVDEKGNPVRSKLILPVRF